MKTEILRIQNIKIPVLPVDYFKDFSLHLFAGEILCILAPSWNGKTLLAKTLSGGISFRGYAWFQEDRIRNSFKKKVSAGFIFCLSKDQGLFGELSIAENIFLSQRSFRPLLIHRQKLLQKAVEILSILDLNINPAKKARTLSAFEQHMVLLSKALSAHPKLIIFDDPIRYYSQQECQKLKEIIQLLQGWGISVLYLSSGVDDIALAADRVLIMNSSWKIKTFYKSECFSRYDLMRFFRQPNSQPMAPSSMPNTTQKGNIIGIFDPNNHDRDFLHQLLLKEIRTADGIIHLNGVDFSKAGRKKIHFLPSDFAYREIFNQMSIFENVHLFRRCSFFFISSGVKKFSYASIEEMLSIPRAQQNLPAGGQDIYTKIRIVLYRYLLINPYVIIFDMPFSNLDYKGRQIVRDFFRLYKQVGINIILTSPQRENLPEVSTKILILEKGNLKEIRCKGLKKYPPS